MKGKAIIELKNINNGEVEIHEEHNIVTDAIYNFVSQNPWGLKKDNGRSPAAQMCGIGLFQHAIEESREEYKITQIPLAFAGNFSSTHEREGSMVGSNCKTLANGVQYQYVFGPNQANGQISAIALLDGTEITSSFFSAPVPSSMSNRQLCKTDVAVGVPVYFDEVQNILYCLKINNSDYTQITDLTLNKIKLKNKNYVDIFAKLPSTNSLCTVESIRITLANDLARGNDIRNVCNWVFVNGGKIHIVSPKRNSYVLLHTEITMTNGSVNQYEVDHTQYMTANGKSFATVNNYKFGSGYTESTVGFQINAAPYYNGKIYLPIVNTSDIGTGYISTDILCDYLVVDFNTNNEIEIKEIRKPRIWGNCIVSNNIVYSYYFSNTYEATSYNWMIDLNTGDCLQFGGASTLGYSNTCMLALNKDFVLFGYHANGIYGQIWANPLKYYTINNIDTITKTSEHTLTITYILYN